jgi:hypothetical protein
MSGPLHFRKVKSASSQASVRSERTITTESLPHLLDGWVIDAQYRQLSQKTTDWRKGLIDRLIWFLREKKYSHCTSKELKLFLSYAGNEAGERWGDLRHALLLHTIAMMRHYCPSIN